MKQFFNYLSVRIKSYAFWTSMFALIPILCQAFGVFKIPDNYQDIVNTLLTFLIAAGIVNNPTTTSKWFKDDTTDNTTNDKQS